MKIVFDGDGATNEETLTDHSSDENEEGAIPEQVDGFNERTHRRHKQKLQERLTDNVLVNSVADNGQYYVSDTPRQDHYWS